MKDVKEMLSREWQEMLNRGTIPVIELEHSYGEFTVVWIQYEYWRGGAGLYFNIVSDLERPTYFSGDIVKRNGSHYLPADKFTSSLQSMLEQVHTEVMEGYIIPNGIRLIDDE